MAKIAKFVLPLGLLAGALIPACQLRYARTSDGYNVPRTTLAFERGRHLTLLICAQCHMNPADGRLIGIRMHEIPALLGKVYSANLTRSRSHGITDHYTDGELRYLVKRGIARDGHFLSYMLKPNMADEDLDDIIVYLRSQDGPVRSADTTVGLTHLTPLGKLSMNFLGKPVAYHSGIQLPPTSDTIALGRYLVDNIGCYHCHSRSFTSLNYLQPELSKGYMAGGHKFHTPAGKVYAANLTPDKQTGIGNWTREQFRRAVRNGEAPEGRLHAPMPRFQELKDEEADAIFAYLSRIPPIQHARGD